MSVQESPPTGSCSTDKVTGVTDNATSLTDAGYYIGNTSPVDGALKTYYGFAPAQGTHNIVMSASASCILYATAATYTGVEQSGFPDASGTGNPLNDSGAVTTFQATTTTANNNAWAVLVGVPSQSGSATAGLNTTIRQQQSGALYYADSNGPVSPAGSIGLNWSTASSTHWLSNYFSITPVTSYPGTTATTTLGYDDNGNLLWTTTGATTTNYAYDYLSRLIGSRTTGESATTTYAYDAFGNRVSITVGSTTTVYPNKYFSEIMTTGSGTSTTATSTEYIFDPGQNGRSDTLLATIDQPMINGVATGTPVVRYNHPDNLGSTNVTSDTNGNLAQWFDYAPYGSVNASENTGTTTAARQFLGQFSDASGLSYLQNRYYNSAQGQFLTEDPVFLGYPKRQKLQDPQSLNSYSYSDDNPIVKEDPTGRGGVDPFDIIALLSAEIAGGALEQSSQAVETETPSLSAMPEAETPNFNPPYVEVNGQSNEITDLPDKIPSNSGGKIIFGVLGTTALIGALEDYGEKIQEAIDAFADIPNANSLGSITLTNGNQMPASYLTSPNSHTACGALCATPVYAPTPHSQSPSSNYPAGQSTSNNSGGGYYTSYLPADYHTVCGTACR